MLTSHMQYITRAVLLLCLSSVSHAVTSIEVQALLGKKVVVQIDGVRRTLSPGKASPEGVKLISSDRHGATLSVDGNTKEYRLGSSVSMNYAEPVALRRIAESPHAGAETRRNQCPLNT